MKQFLAVGLSAVLVWVLPGGSFYQAWGQTVVAGGQANPAPAVSVPVQVPAFGVHPGLNGWNVSLQALSPSTSLKTGLSSRRSLLPGAVRAPVGHAPAHARSLPTAVKPAVAAFNKALSGQGKQPAGLSRLSRVSSALPQPDKGRQISRRTRSSWSFWSRLQNVWSGLGLKEDLRVGIPVRGKIDQPRLGRLSVNSRRVSTPVRSAASQGKNSRNIPPFPKRRSSGSSLPLVLGFLTIPGMVSLTEFFKGMGPSVYPYLSKPAGVLGIVAGTWLAARIVKRFSRTVLSRTELRPAERAWIVRLIGLGVYAVGTLGLLNLFGVSLSGVVAGLGLFSMGLGIATKDAVTQVVKGLRILYSGRFRVGDIVEISGKTGRVVDITLFYTTIEELEADENGKIKVHTFDNDKLPPIITIIKSKEQIEEERKSALEGDPEDSSDKNPGPSNSN